MSEEHPHGHKHHHEHPHNEAAKAGGMPIHPRWLFVIGAALMVLVVLVWTLLL